MTPPSAAIYVAAMRLERRTARAYEAYRAKAMESHRSRDLPAWSVLDTYERDAWRAGVATLDEGDDQ